MKTKVYVILKATKSFPPHQKDGTNICYFAHSLSSDKLRKVPPLLLRHLVPSLHFPLLRDCLVVKLLILLALNLTVYANQVYFNSSFVFKLYINQPVTTINKLPQTGTLPNGSQLRLTLTAICLPSLCSYLGSKTTSALWSLGVDAIQ